MANDFESLAKSWQQQQPQDELPNAADLTKANQRQKKQRRLMYMEWFGAVVMLVTAIWLFIAIPDLLGYLSATFLIAGAISSLYISWQIHRPILAYDNWSSNGLLEFRSKTCRLTLLHYRYTQLSCGALILFTLLLWALNYWQLAATPHRLLSIYTLLVSPVCLYAIAKYQQKVKLKKAELVELSALAKDFQH